MDYRESTGSYVQETRSISERLIERSLEMRCLAYLSDVKGKLLTDTIFEVDVSRKRLLQAKKTVEEQLVQAQKMESLGILVGGIAHDFNNMLCGISGNIFLARNKGNNPDILNSKLDNIEEIVFTAGEMIQHLLTFAKKNTVVMKPVLLNKFIRDSMRLLKTSVPDDVAFKVTDCRDDLVVMADVTQLQQVLLNLLLNAFDAVKDVDTPLVSIEVDKFIGDNLFMTRHHRQQTNKFARFTIKDNGKGIEAEDISRIFEPFYTTKAVGEGSGLGLSMAFGAIESHNGAIEVESTPGEGATFYLYLPLHAAVPEQEVDAAPVVNGNQELILLVDDDPMVLSIHRDLLESLEFKVLSATDGQEALELFEQSKDRLAMIVSDVVMPRMSGLELARTIRNKGSSVPVILCTGYDGNIKGYEHDSIEDCVLITKPFYVNKLSELIDTMLAKSRES